MKQPTKTQLGTRTKGSNSSTGFGSPSLQNKLGSQHKGSPAETSRVDHESTASAGAFRRPGSGGGSVGSSRRGQGSVTPSRSQGVGTGASRSRNVKNTTNTSTPKKASESKVKNSPHRTPSK